VPKTIVNDEIEILGALPPDAFIEQALSQVSTLKAQVPSSADL